LRTGPLAKRLKPQPGADTARQHGSSVAAASHSAGPQAAPARQSRDDGSGAQPRLGHVGAAAAATCQPARQQAEDDIDDDEFLQAMAEQFEAEDGAPAAPAAAAPARPAASCGAAGAAAAAGPSVQLRDSQEDDMDALLQDAYADEPGGGRGQPADLRRAAAAEAAEAAAIAAALEASAAEAAAAAAYTPPAFDAHTLDGEVMPVTLDTGLRAYCRMLEAPAAAERPAAASAAAAGCQSLLSKPIAQLMRQVDDEAFAKALARSTAEHCDAEETGVASCRPSLSAQDSVCSDFAG